MRTYRVEVVDRNSGVSDAIYVEGDSPADATESASGMGWIVGKVTEAPVKDTAVPRPIIHARPVALDIPKRPSQSVGFSATFAVILAVAGGIVFVEATQAHASESRLGGLFDRPGERFKDDNAMGATANALERMRIENRRDRGQTQALLLFGFAAVVAVTGRR